MLHLKRFIAHIIDWNLALFPSVLILGVVLEYLEKTSRALPVISLLLVLAGPALFVLRDLLFGGRSPGKRLMRLQVHDCGGENPPTATQLLQRNLFFFLDFVNFILLIITGKTIGDRVSQTVVLDEKTREILRERALPPESPRPRRPGFRRILLIVAAALLALAAFLGFVQAVLNAQKDTEQYKIAYDYLISSETFRTGGAAESDIRLNRYSISTSGLPGSADSGTAEIGFMIGRRSYDVVCHLEDGVWRVCRDCTPFE